MALPDLERIILRRTQAEHLRIHQNGKARLEISEIGEATPTGHEFHVALAQALGEAVRTDITAENRYEEQIIDGRMQKRPGGLAASYYQEDKVFAESLPVQPDGKPAEFAVAAHSDLRGPEVDALIGLDFTVNAGNVLLEAQRHRINIASIVGDDFYDVDDATRQKKLDAVRTAVITRKAEVFTQRTIDHSPSGNSRLAEVRAHAGHLECGRSDGDRARTLAEYIDYANRVVEDGVQNISPFIDARGGNVLGLDPIYREQGRAVFRRYPSTQAYYEAHCVDDNMPNEAARVTGQSKKARRFNVDHDFPKDPSLHEGTENRTISHEHHVAVMVIADKDSEADRKLAAAAAARTNMRTSRVNDGSQEEQEAGSAALVFLDSVKNLEGYMAGLPGLAHAVGAGGDTNRLGLLAWGGSDIYAAQTKGKWNTVRWPHMTGVVIQDRTEEKVISVESKEEQPKMPLVLVTRQVVEKMGGRTAFLNSIGVVDPEHPEENEYLQTVMIIDSETGETHNLYTDPRKPTRNTNEFQRQTDPNVTGRVFRVSPYFPDEIVVADPRRAQPRQIFGR